tara:strand:+ start:248 stop:841 length:594 start_codon:yes stop_codon:yes gene_type:complete
MIIVALWFLFAVLMGWITPNDLPDWQNLKESMWVLVIGFLYYALPIRKTVNRRFHEKVCDNLVAKLVAAADLESAAPKYTWKQIRPFFFSIVDADPSLTIKSKLAYSNGYLWTTAADARAVSVVYLCLAIFLAVLGKEEAVGASIVFLALFLMTYFLSHFLTEKHIEIGNEQVEIISLKYREELRNVFADVRDDTSK